MKIFQNTKGETLAETIIALSVLAIGITIASTIILNSMRNLTNAKNRVIAVNIAREGIEAMRNIRDTNWLFYSDKRRTCWNNNPNMICDGNNPIKPGVYIIYKKNDNSWQLINADKDTIRDENGDNIPDNDVDLERSKISLVDINSNFDSDKDGDKENDFDMYNHKHNSATNSLGIETKTTPFTRYITIEYIKNSPNPPIDTISTLNEWGTISDKSVLNRMRITSTVEWIRGATHRVELTTIITDHLGRKNLKG